MGFMNNIGITSKDYENASASTVREQFEVLPSGAYQASIESIIIYNLEGETKQGEKYSQEKLKISVKLDESERIVSFDRDVGKTLKDGSINPGFVSRLKSICEATGFDIDDFKGGDSTKVNVFGKDMDGKFVNGVNGKKVIALIRKNVDTSLEEGTPYREVNAIEGITKKGNEDIELFEAKVKKNGGEFKFKGKGAKSTSGSSKSPEEKKEIAKTINF